MSLVIILKRKKERLNNEKTCAIVDKDELRNGDASGDERLEKEGKKTRLGAAPDGKCQPERGDFACYMDDSSSGEKHSKSIIQNKTNTPGKGEKRGKT